MIMRNESNLGLGACTALKSFDSLDHLPVAILVLDSHFRIVFSNGRFGGLLGADKEELKYSPFMQHVSARDPIAVIGLGNILRESEFTISVRTKDLTTLDLCCSSTVVKLPDETMGTLLVFHDSLRLRTAIIEEERAVSMAAKRTQELEKALKDLNAAQQQLEQFESKVDRQVEARTAMLKKEMVEAVRLRQQAEFQAKRVLELAGKKSSLFENFHELLEPVRGS